MWERKKVGPSVYGLGFQWEYSGVWRMGMFVVEGGGRECAAPRAG